MGDEHVTRDTRDEHLDDDLRRVEPVELLAPIYGELQAHQTAGKQHESEPIEWPRRVGCLTAQGEPHAAERHEQKRHVHEEHGAPTEVFRQPATKPRPDHGTHHHADPQHGERARQQLARIRVLQCRLSQRDQHGAAESLQKSRCDQRLDVGRKSAADRGDAEPADGQQERPPQTETRLERCKRRQRHGTGDQVRREYPGGLFASRGQVALQHRQSNIGHRGVDGIQQHGEHRARCEQ